MNMLVKLCGSAGAALLSVSLFFMVVNGIERYELSLIGLVGVLLVVLGFFCSLKGTCTIKK